MCPGCPAEHFLRIDKGALAKDFTIFYYGNIALKMEKMSLSSGTSEAT